MHEALDTRFLEIRPCPTCDGAGMKMQIMCTRCEGSGSLIECMTCDGTGITDDNEECSVCHHTGFVPYDTAKRAVYDRIMLRKQATQPYPIVPPKVKLSDTQQIVIADLVAHQVLTHPPTWLVRTIAATLLCMMLIVLLIHFLPR